MRLQPSLAFDLPRYPLERVHNLTPLATSLVDFNVDDIGLPMAASDSALQIGVRSYFEDFQQNFQ